ncbi:hypothetical protein Ctha_1468 [Chloroherpeton thalassium ATCC 35110]|uniref:STAS domain-containing protein n=1 Tax=Chloroherpeton thalassium (strain ATCC 35110 / GB-78) TaxID=517418 RepID=B3QRX4_CHLT3|nr:hypothetical protein [Chloroherpeton thalassium]ACF13927.1 hypothetical protein Ctha_1468 [Chloroherpeton thalassium ATCC 35110]
MELKTQWNEEKGFWDIAVSGEVFYDDCLQELNNLLEQMPKPSGNLVLLTIEAADLNLTNTDIYYLVRLFFERHYTPFKKMAVMTNQQKNLDKVKFLELCAVNRGMDVFVAQDRAAAEERLLR